MSEPLLIWGVASGLAMLFGFLFMTWKLEGMWFSPGSVFAFAFVCHAFVAPMNMYENNVSTLNLESLLQAQILSAVCFFALGAGYFAGIGGVIRGHKSAAVPKRLSPQGTSLCVAMLLVCIAIHVAYSLTEGTLTEGKGAWAYSADSSYWGRIKATATVFIVPLFLTAITSVASFQGTRRKALISAIALGLAIILAHSLMTFGRHLIAQLLMVAVVFYHFRVAAIRPKHLAAALLLLFTVSLFADIRVFGDGIMNLSSDEIISQLKLSLIESSDPFRFILNIAGAIAGQEVFTQVLLMVPGQEDFRYGLTYIQSAVGLLTPRVFTGNYDSIDTPAFWFKDAYAPYVINHGFDFSMLSEAYLNFGFLMWVPYLVLGYVLARVSNTIRHTSSQLSLVVCIIFLIALITGLRTDSNAMFKTMIFTPLPVLALFAVAKWKFVLAKAPTSPTQNPVSPLLANQRRRAATR